MKLSRGTLFLRDESGAALIVESSIVYPIVFVSILFLVMMSLIFVQKSILQSDAEKAAEYIARTITYDGYSDVMKLSIDGVEYNENLSKEDVDVLLTDEKLYDALARNTVDLKKYEKQVEEIASEHNFFRTNELDCSIQINNNVLNNSVTVTIKNQLQISDFFANFGFLDEFYYEVSAVATFGSPSEFVRDVKLVEDLGNMINGQVVADKITKLIIAINQ